MKLSNGVSMALALCMICPSTVSATVSDNQVGDQVTDTQKTAKKDIPVDNKHHVSNMFVNPTSKYIAFDGTGKLDLYLYSGEKTQYLANMYIVMPKGLSADGGLAGVKQSITAYERAIKVHDGFLDVQQLSNTSDGREVYAVIPTASSYIVAGEHNDFDVLSLPIKAVGKDSGTSEILFNANTIDNISQDMLFIGAGNGKDVAFDTSVSSYPQVDSARVGISSESDIFVRGIVLNGIQRKLELFTPNVVDTYKVKDISNNVEVTSKEITGRSSESYSRVGQVDTLSSLGLDPEFYDEKSLKINSGNLNDTKIKWVPQNALTNNPNIILEGQTYIITVKKFGGNITAKYQDEAGNQLIVPEIFKGDIGDAYQTEQKEVPGYTYKAVKGNPNGIFSDKAQTVTYIYTKDPVQAADVTVKYEDEAGNTIADNVRLSGNIGDTYQTEQKEISGYTYKVVKSNPNGIFSDKAQTVTYVYTKDPVQAADVTVKYEDEAGNTIADNITLSGNIGDAYQTEQKEISGYTYKAVKGNPNGIFSDKAQTVTYIYTKDPVQAADVTAKYEDEAGNTIADNITLSGNIGDTYQTMQKEVPGYTYKEVKGNPNGIFSDKVQTVTYIYTKDPVQAADVTAKYEDEAGNTIADNVTLSGNIGDTYQTMQKEVPGYTYKAVKGNPNGIFSDKAQTVTYIYTKTPIASHDENDIQDGNKVLPQTGINRVSNLFTITGALMAFISIVGLRKRKNK
ncbi:MucBP domain-containing protein [Latilactobacillus sakei]